jgi:predicted secreted hydrolase
MTAVGELRNASGAWVAVEGQAWMDHQWGNFVVPSGGGWDWFSLQLADNTELMLYVLRTPEGETTAVYGTRIEADGSARDLAEGAIEITPTGHWTSPHSGGTYPLGWRIEAPDEALRLWVTPRLDDQELYFPGAAVESPIYWEGAVLVEDERGSEVGLGYVELTGYAPERPRPAAR